VAYQQRKLLRSDIYQQAVYNLDLMADASLEALLKYDYVTVRTFVTRWGKTHDEIYGIWAVAPNGFVLAEYRNPIQQAGEVYSLSKEVVIEDRPVATIHLVGDYRNAEMIASKLRNRLIISALIITALFGTALWYIFRVLALTPLEDMVAQRTEALSAANKELQQEISERTKAEEKVKEREGHITLILNSIAEGIYGVDLQGNCTFCNPAALRLLGYEVPAEVIGKPIHQLIHHTRPDGSPYQLADCVICQCYSTGIGCHVDDEVFWRSDGTSFPVEYWAQPIIRDGVSIGAVTAFTDISEKKRLEAQIRQSQKMESIGTLAGGIAHDFNNILSVILGYGEMTLTEMAKDDPMRPNLEHMIEAGERAAHLTKELLLFSRKQPLDRKPADLNEIIRRLEKFLIRVIGEDIEFTTKLHEGELPVLADSNQLEQVFMNLATNARDSMKEGGAFSITTEQIMLDDEVISTYGLNKPGRYALISVSDTGDGMNEETRQRVFEPFFTTKEVGKGTGLGLSVVYGILKQHEGVVNVYSEPGIGSTFRIYLPLIASWQKEENEEPEAEYPKGGTETILLAEDSENVRKLMESVLKGHGYTVIVAVDGEDAVRKFQENKDRVDLLFFDVIMPKKSGKEAYDEIVKINPKVKTLFATGYSADIVRSKAFLGDGATVIYKPIAPMDILREVRNILDKGKA
jgi:PAS domain S-box-containing protein